MWYALSKSFWQISTAKAVGVSAFLHAGAIGALAGWTLAEPDQIARFSGQQHVVYVQWAAEASPDIPPAPRFAAPPVAAPVLITPQRAQIEQRRLIDTLAPPLPDSLQRALVDPPVPSVPTPVLAARAESVDAQPNPTDTPTEHQPLERTPADPSSPASASAVPVASLGTDSTIPPSFANNQPPRYPDLARRNGWEGTVLLELTIDEAGVVTGVRVVESSGHTVLDAAAVTAIRMWKGQPARRGGRAVGTQERLPVRFRL